MYRLHIKGNLDAARAELLKREIIPDRTEQTLPNETIVTVNPKYYNVFVEWFCEKPNLVYGYGYPDGTLLFYSLV